MLGYVYGHTTGGDPRSSGMSTRRSRGLTRRQTTCRSFQLGSPTLHEPRFWNQGRGARREPLWATVVWVAGRQTRTQAHVYVACLSSLRPLERSNDVEPDGIELMIIVTATFAQSLAGSGPGVSIVGVLIAWRFILGVGVGGDYPLSAVIASEFASTRSRGRLMTAVFTAQGWGNFGTDLTKPRI